MFCEQPAPEPEKKVCRCKNCVLRHSDILPWPEPLGFMAERDNDKDGHNSRRVSTRTIPSMDSVYTLRDGTEKQQNDHYKNQNNNRNEPTISSYPAPYNRHEGTTPANQGGTTPAYYGTGGNTPIRTLPTQQQQQPAQPTILLIVVNKNDPPPFPPGRGYPGYPGPGAGYQSQGRSPRYQGQGPYQGPGPREFPSPGGGPPRYYYPPPGPGNGPRGRPRPNYEHEHVRYNQRRYSDGLSNSRNGYQDRFQERSQDRYQDDWNGQPRYSYAGQPRILRRQEDRRNCRCAPPTEKSQPESPPSPPDNEDVLRDQLEASNKKKSKQRLVGSGIGNTESGRNGSMGTPNNTTEYYAESESPQEVIVTDAKNKTYKCIQVPICISTGKTNTCRCCKCAPVEDPEKEESLDEEAECVCNQNGKCTCVPGEMFQDENACQCDLTNLERILRELIPNADCMCYLKKKRRRRRKKWTPKVYYDRFANPPFVLNPKPRCLDYGISPFRNPCYNPCCCAPVGKSCYNCDYGCRC
ncbi:uncharacterized protein CG42266 [Drosophila suzukii]|uniref:Uncharacterized protein CG42266 n=1 Tax=Drosophila suzukii TaxID=28584 RepID=A0AB39ZZG5_DROSZ